MSNLGKDWKDELTDKELHSLQYEAGHPRHSHYLSGHGGDQGK